MKARVADIFRSIQGEGPYTGRDTLFVRFAGCNIGTCRYCDTDFKSYREMDVREVLSEAGRLSGAAGPRMASVTGGEPLMQDGFLKALLPELRRRDMRLLLETNGTLPERLSGIRDMVDVVSMDIKLPGSVGGVELWEEHRRFLAACAGKEVYVKLVVDERSDEREFRTAIGLLGDAGPSVPLFLQPAVNGTEGVGISLAALDRFYKVARSYVRSVTVSTQMHKVVGVA